MEIESARCKPCIFSFWSGTYLGRHQQSQVLRLQIEPFYLIPVPMNPASGRQSRYGTNAEQWLPAMASMLLDLMVFALFQHDFYLMFADIAATDRRHRLQLVMQFDSG